MKLEKLAEKAREELDYHATKILERDFDDQNVALFLIYGRDALEKDTALLDFANSVAHTRPDRDKLFKAADGANKLGSEDWMDTTKTMPIGTVGYTVTGINKELNSVMAALDHPAVSQEAAEDFVACLCAIGNHLEFHRQGQRAGWNGERPCSKRHLKPGPHARDRPSERHSLERAPAYPAGWLY